ncbi:MAG: branched-chain amino acid ABC transporter permease [Rhizobiaceae bacterium]
MDPIYLQLLVQGLAIGAIYGLVALGFVLIINTVNVVNFAQGEFLMLGGFVGLTFGALLGFPYWAVLVCTVIVFAILGTVFDKVIYQPLRGGDFATHLIGTLAAALIIRNVAQHIWGPEARSYYEPFHQKIFDVGGVLINPQHLLILAMTVLLVAGLYYFLFRTGLGRLMRATAQDRETARLLGVKVKHVGTLTFSMSLAMGGVAGVMVAPLFLVDLNVGFIAGLKAFIATIIGGWGSIPGALAGGLLVGLVEIFATHFFTAAFKDPVAFAVLMLFLIVRPSGIFSERVGDKA